jgi:2'-5' RNA ligase
MASLTPTVASELDYATYQARQLRETTADQLAYRATQLRQSNKFVYEQIPPAMERSKVGVGFWRGLSYEGYAVVSMVDSNPQNNGLSDQLRAMQQQLLACFENPATCFLLPSASFHQTVANTLSDDRFREHIVANNLQDQYPAMVQDAFQHVSAATEPNPIQMRMVGLSLFSGAIGILGTFDDEADFDRVLAFREQFYADKNLMKLTVRRTRPFIGHITLAYLETELSATEKSQLVETCVAVNQALTERPLFFNISTTELRSYPHLADFQTKPGYPVYRFVCS